MRPNQSPIRSLILLTAALLGSAAGARADLSPAWVERWASADGRKEGAADIATDADGNVYVVATSEFNQLTSANLVTLSYAPDGTLRWLDTYDGGGQDLAVAVATDELGRVAVLGRASGDFLVLVYDGGTGTRLDEIVHDAGGIDDPRALALGPGGAIAVTGSSWTDQENDYYTATFEANGALRWSARYQGPGQFLFAHDVAYAVAFDASGDVFVTGSSNAPGTASGDFVTIKYRGADGVELWLDRYSEGTNEVAYDLAVDGAGDPYVTGGSYQSGFVYVTRKYSGGDGSLLWMTKERPAACSVATALALDGVGNLYVTGWADPDCDESNFNDDIVTVRYGAGDGVKAWSTSYGSPAVWHFEIPTDLAIDSSGRPWVTGVTVGVLVLLGYAPEGGAIVSTATVAAGPDEQTGASALAFDSDDTLYLAGAARDVNTEARDVLTLRFDSPWLFREDFESGTFGSWSIGPH